jgi:hypothetical protein
MFIVPVTLHVPASQHTPAEHAARPEQSIVHICP